PPPVELVRDAAAAGTAGRSRRQRVRPRPDGPPEAGRSTARISHEDRTGLDPGWSRPAHGRIVADDRETPLMKGDPAVRSSLSTSRFGVPIAHVNLDRGDELEGIVRRARSGDVAMVVVRLDAGDL